MKNNWENLKELIEYPKSGVLSKTLKKTGSGDTTLFCLSKEAEISEHTSTREGVVYVIEGRGEFVLAGEKIKMIPGTLIFMDKNAIHSLRCFENTSFLLLLHS